MKYLKLFEELDREKDEDLVFDLTHKVADLFVEYADKWDLLEVEDPLHYESSAGKVPYDVTIEESRIIVRIVLINLIGYDYSRIDNDRRPDHGDILSEEFKLDMEQYISKVARLGLKGKYVHNEDDPIMFYIDFDFTNI